MSRLVVKVPRMAVLRYVDKILNAHEGTASVMGVYGALNPTVLPPLVGTRTLMYPSFWHLRQRSRSTQMRI